MPLIDVVVGKEQLPGAREMDGLPSDPNLFGCSIATHTVSSFWQTPCIKSAISGSLWECRRSGLGSAWSGLSRGWKARLLLRRSRLGPHRARPSRTADDVCVEIFSGC